MHYPESPKVTPWGMVLNHCAPALKLKIYRIMNLYSGMAKEGVAIYKKSTSLCALLTGVNKRIPL